LGGVVGRERERDQCLRNTQGKEKGIIKSKWFLQEFSFKIGF
jgi:hypothetical protein